jgi:hypothetical protein
MDGNEMHNDYCQNKSRWTYLASRCKQISDDHENATMLSIEKVQRTEKSDVASDKERGHSPN